MLRAKSDYSSRDVTCVPAFSIALSNQPLYDVTSDDHNECYFTYTHSAKLVCHTKATFLTFRPRCFNPNMAEVLGLRHTHMYTITACDT